MQSKKIMAGFIWLSIATALLTAGLKYLAFLYTNSVSLLSDALESIVNLVAATFALLMSNYANKPADADHPYGHNKTEYFSGVTEGGLILFAGGAIIFTAISRLLHPEPLSVNVVGLSISSLAALLNFITATFLLKKSVQYKSIILEADGQHLMTDVYTSAGVLFGVLMIPLTKIMVLDQLIALVVGFWITTNAVRIIKKSLLGLMDTALPQKELALINRVLAKYQKTGISFHKVYTRQSGMCAFMTGHILVPKQWTIKKAHTLAHKIEREIKHKLANIDITFHVEPQ